MYIHKMTDLECRRALQQATVGRLACARDNQPYVVPTYFAFDGKQQIYAFTTVGQKIEFMRSNPRVCLEIDERTTHNQWTSVIVFGRYEELPDLPRYEGARIKAYELLEKHVMWWEPAYVGAAHSDIPHSDEPILYRIKIDRMTGHRASPDMAEIALGEGDEAKARNGWWAEILGHLRLKT